MNIDWNPTNPLDLQQWLICYRKKYKEDNWIDLNERETPDRLYYASVPLPNKEKNIRLENWDTTEFIDKVVGSLDALGTNGTERNQVVLYIHGYDYFSALKLKLFSAFTRNYLSNENNKIAKTIFFTWPSMGWIARKKVDDRSLEAGYKFTQLGLFNDIKALSDRLKSKGYQLNLFVHSFGCQLLNGMLNSEEGEVPSGLFNKIFLMAPDITRKSIQVGGANVINHYDDDPGEDTVFYDLSRLKKLGKEVYIFHDKYDYLLYVSTKKFIGKKRRKKVDDKDAERLSDLRTYGNLGNFGKEKIKADDPINFQDGFEFRNIQKLVDADFQPTKKYPFQRLKRRLKRFVQGVWDNYRYKGIKGKVFGLTRLSNHHRYLFTAKNVVEEVQEILKT